MKGKMKVTEPVLRIARTIFNSPHRVKIILLLTKKKLSTLEINKKLGISRSKICYHLNGLENMGLLSTEYQSTEHQSTDKP
ncbi:ArsR family transcriptional regulator [Candidatus Atribacteria bacterium MT.SAG.1]|nr:ArsR family transcriptional regulator [Candidatus Atribacteria bacterium MT.SAG.1]